MKRSISFVISMILLIGLVWVVVAGRETAVAHNNLSSSEISTALGEPGLSFRYVATMGTTGEPYLADGDYLNSPYGIGVDNANNIWVGEWAGARAVKYDSNGVYQMSIGQAGVRDPDNNQNLLNSVADTAVDNSGNIWLADPDTHRVVKYNAAGEFQSQLGVTWEEGSDNSHFNSPRGVGLDNSGNLYVSDNRNHRLQVFDSSGTYTATIGISGVSGSDNNHLNGPRHFTIGSNNLLYVADMVNHRVQVFDVSNPQTVNYITTLGTTGEEGSDNSHFRYPMGVAVDSTYIYVVDGSNLRVQVFDRATYVYQSTLNVASSGYLADIVIDSLGNISIVDSNMRVQVYDSSLNYVRTLGTVGVPYLTDANHFYELYSIEMTPDGDFVTVENGGHRLIKLDENGNQLWAVGEAGISGDDSNHLNNPLGTAVAPNGNIYVTDARNHRVQIFNANGVYQDTIGSHGTGNYELSWPTSIAIASNGDIYIVDHSNQRVQVFNSSHTYMGTIGVTGVSGSDNSHFNGPHGVAVDSNGTIYVSDEGNSRVQVFNNNRVYIRTMGVTGVCDNSFDHFCGNHGVEVDGQNRLYVADAWNTRIQVFDDTGAYLTTISGDWGDRIGEMNGPRDMAVAADGTLFITDLGNYRILKYTMGVPGWKQVNLNGFGKQENRGAWALHNFNNALYVSTTNSGTNTGGEVYRYSSNTWEQVVSNGFGDSSNDVNVFAEFGGSLYAGTWNYDDDDNSTGGQIWRSASGDNGSWERVVNNGFSDAVNCEVMSMIAFNGYLYAGTWSCDTNTHGAEIWRSSTGNSGSWTRVAGNTIFGDGNNAAILSMETLNNNLYVATDNSTSGGEVWRTSNGTTWTQVNTDGFGSSDNTRTVSLTVFDNYLYAGTWNSIGGGQVWRSSNGTSWAQVVGDGFGKVENKDIASLIAFDNQLYAVVGNFETGAEVWRSTTGNSGDWELVIDQGFGDGHATFVDWDNMTAVYENNLYMGTFTFGNNGGRVWQLNEQHLVYLPLVVR